jgi:lysophospholipase
MEDSKQINNDVAPPEKVGQHESSKNVLVNEISLYYEDQAKKYRGKLDPNKERKVLIIYTGGTIGMQTSERGYALQKNHFHRLMKSNRYFCDSDYTYFNAKEDFLITPASIYQKRIQYRIHEFEEIIDSSNMTHQYWVSIASFVEKNYHLYDGFIILHGTDTMAYTASALSFMFENLRKTVILTGAQVPLIEMRNDAFDNLLGSLTIAGHFIIPEVTVYFRDKLFRGNRSTKADSFGLNAFDSPRLPPLANFGLDLEIDWKHIRKAPQGSYDDLNVSYKLSDKVGVLKYYPLIPTEVVKSVFESHMDAVIIEAYGVGNLPNNRPDVTEIITQAAKRGILVAIITQCYKGIVVSLYAVGKDLEELGVCSGHDMTLECAITKLSYLLGKVDENYTKKDVRRDFGRDLRGELTSQKGEQFEMKEENFIKSLSEAINMNTDNEALRQALFPSIVCYAADFGYIASLQELKANGANLSSADYDGRTPLHFAARNGKLEVTKYLIGDKANVNAADKNGRSPLFEALLNGHMDISKELVRAGARVIASEEEICNYLLRLVRDSNLKDLKHAFHCGIKNLSDYKNMDGRTVGHLAASDNNMEILTFLKEEALFNFSAADRWSKTPLDEAHYHKHTKSIEYLSTLPVKRN